MKLTAIHNAGNVPIVVPVPRPSSFVSALLETLEGSDTGDVLLDGRVSEDFDVSSMLVLVSVLVVLVVDDSVDVSILLSELVSGRVVEVDSSVEDAVGSLLMVSVLVSAVLVDSSSELVEVVWEIVVAMRVTGVWVVAAMVVVSVDGVDSTSFSLGDPAMMSSGGGSLSLPGVRSVGSPCRSGIMGGTRSSGGGASSMLPVS